MYREPQDRLLTVQAAAARIGLPEAEMRRAMVNGRLPFVRRGLRYWIREEDLKKYQERIWQTHKSPQATISLPEG